MNKHSQGWNQVNMKEDENPLSIENLPSPLLAIGILAGFALLWVFGGYLIRVISWVMTLF